MSRLVDPVLSARLRELPVYLSPEPGTNASPSSDMPKSVVSAQTPKPLCTDYAAFEFVAAYVKLTRDAPSRKFQIKEQQIKQPQDQQQAKIQVQQQQPSHKNLASINLVHEHTQAACILVEETQREMQGQKQDSAFEFDSNTSPFLSASSPLSPIPDLQTRDSKQAVMGASATATAERKDSPMFESCRNGDSMSESSSLTPSSSQQQRSASQPLRSVISLTSLLGVNSFFGSPTV